LVEKGRIFSSSHLDVQWFVQQIGQYLRKNSLRADDPKSLFRQAINFIYEIYFARVSHGKRMPLSEYPLAAISWIRIEQEDGGTVIEYLRLGDCPLFVLSKDGLMLLELSNTSTAEHIVRGKAQAASRDVSNRDTRELSKYLKSRREQQHTDPSSGVFAVNPASVEYAASGSLRPEGNFNIVMCTDGLFRLVDLFGYYSTKDFCASCEKAGFKSLMQELRKLENAPTSLLQYPRLKRHDDASGMLIQYNDFDLRSDRRFAS
jgi:hypothetical protein